jgi:hypothetical protein
MENASRNPKISFIAIPQFTGGYFIANFRVRGSAALEKTDKADSSIARFPPEIFAPLSIALLSWPIASALEC